MFKQQLSNNDTIQLGTIQSIDPGQFYPPGTNGIDLAAAQSAAEATGPRPPQGLYQITWTNEGGLYFNTPANWSNNATPNEFDAGTITLAKAESIYSISSAIGALITNNLVSIVVPDYGPDNSFTVGTGNSLSSTFTNGGSVELEATKGDTCSFIVASPTLTLNGGGTITLFNENNRDLISGSSGTTLQNVNNTIIGGGLIGTGGLAFVNATAGTVTADVAGTLTINTGAIGITNNGTMESTFGTNGFTSTLAIDSNLTQGATGLIEAAAGNVVLDGITVTGGTLAATAGTLFLQSTTVSGCTLQTSGSGVFDLASQSATLINETLAGTLDIANGQ